MRGAARWPRAWWAAALATAATYFYFLLFAEFALLELARGAGADGARLRGLMAVLGASGLAGAVWAARGFAVARGPGQLRRAFAACAAAALLAPAASGVAAWAAVFAAVGGALGALTVVLAAQLAAAAGPGRLGRCIGLGTGLAYAACNLPPLFAAGPGAQAVAAAVAALAGLGASLGLGGDGARPSALPGAEARGPAPRLRRWLPVLLALVWLDSAVFYLVQHVPALKAATWQGDATLLGNAAMHLAAGWVAGVALDRGWERAPAAVAAVALGAASLVLARGGAGVAGVHWLYTAGVSLYSVVLVYRPAVSREARVAAWVFGVAGWGGSALGIGMAQDLQRVPVWFVVVALGVVALGLGVRAEPRPGG